MTETWSELLLHKNVACGLLVHFLGLFTAQSCGKPHVSIVLFSNIILLIYISAILLLLFSFTTFIIPI